MKLGAQQGGQGSDHSVGHPQGITTANITTAKLLSTPTPPPKTTNRTKDATGPGADEVSTRVLSESADMAVSFRAEGAESADTLFPMLEKLRCVHG